MKDKGKLKFNENGTFQIMQLSDLHITKKKKNNKETLEFIVNAAQNLNPDLILLSGDIINGNRLFGAPASDKSKVKKAIRNLMKVLDKLDIPVAICFGEKDDDNRIYKHTQAKIYHKYDCVCVGESYADCGTYYLPVYSSDESEIKYCLWIFDSQYEDDTQKINAVTDNRLEWFRKMSEELKENNGGKEVYSLLFQHTFVPEIYSNLTQVPSNTVGCIQKNDQFYIINKDNTEGFLGEAPTTCVQTGQLSEIRNGQNVIAMVFGNNHTNCFVSEYEDIDLIATPTASAFAYGDELRGLRMLTIYENDTEAYETSIYSYLDILGKNPRKK